MCVHVSVSRRLESRVWGSHAAPTWRSGRDVLLLDNPFKYPYPSSCCYAVKCVIDVPAICFLLIIEVCQNLPGPVGLRYGLSSFLIANWQTITSQWEHHSSIWFHFPCWSPWRLILDCVCKHINITKGVMMGGKHTGMFIVTHGSWRKNWFIYLS